MALGAQYGLPTDSVTENCSAVIAAANEEAAITAEADTAHLFAVMVEAQQMWRCSTLSQCSFWR